MTLTPYASSPVFDEQSLPEKLRNEHRTKDGAWGLLRVLTGEVRLIFTEPHREILVTPDNPASIAPMATHYVVPLGKMSLQVEFYRAEPVLDDVATSEPTDG
ncbi:DUF1971 domain-containing protein [Sphingomonas sp. HMP6]|uniref:DUF1971 domain-containing protein n=1 Tax=Sphingomonas sp. HMP6 TaxID=1517551 RepID=UPI001596D5F5|nr:DUF1971 domain-containing protein [Sphingomonas sp. HMP6]BCA58308.1 hypothetical protein HMP06_1077 [Sphingomonas sp. HMP6]